MQLVYSLGVGGSEMLALNIASGLDRRRFRPYVCALDLDGELAGDLERLEIPRFVMHRRGVEAGVFRRLHQVIRENRIHVVHTHHFTQLLYGAVPARLAGARIVHTEHEFFSYAQSQFGQTLIRPLARLCDRVTAVGPEVAEFFTRTLGVPAMTVVRNGVSFQAFAHDRLAVRRELGLDPSGFVIGTVGRLEPEKDQMTLLEAFRRLKDSGVRARLVIVGVGAMAEELQRQAASLGIADRTMFLGLRRDVPRLLSAMDVFVLTSIREGLPIALIEAMAAGLPVIASDVGSIGDLVKDGQNGLLVPARDVAGFVGAMERLIACPSLRTQLGGAGRRTVEGSFSLSATTRAYEAMYESAAKRAHVRD